VGGWRWPRSVIQLIVLDLKSNCSVIKLFELNNNVKGGHFKCTTNLFDLFVDGGRYYMFT
jgi:hypothetical protein